MFGINWTGAGQKGQNGPGRRGPSPPGHHGLFLLTIVAFALIYAVAVVPLLAISHPLSEGWPLLLYPATPFVTVLGAWKLVRWFGFRRVIVSAIVVVLAAMLSEPLWLPALLDSEPVSFFAYWKEKLLVFTGLAGWIMAALALAIGPVRMLGDFIRSRRASKSLPSSD